MIGSCGSPMICSVLPFIKEFDKNTLNSLVQLSVVLYTKTDKKDKIVSLVVQLAAAALDRSIVLQPLNMVKQKQDSELVKVNTMIGELLFVIVKMNADAFKSACQRLSSSSTSNLQEQLRKTIHMKQSESNAARRRNANRVPVKLDASKFNV